MIAKKHQHDERFRFCPIPDFIYELSPPFWSVFEAHRPLINDILLKEFQENEMLEIPGIIGLLLSLTTTQFSSRLVSNFSECFSFDFRSTFFHQLVHKDLNFLDDVELELNQDNILKESFEKLHKLDPETWLQRIKVSYEGNEGLLNYRMNYSIHKVIFSKSPIKTATSYQVVLSMQNRKKDLKSSNLPA